MLKYIMLPDTSKAFLDQCKQQGMNFDEVASQLVRTGWGPEQIELARKYYLPGVTSSQVTIVPAETEPTQPEEKKGRSGLKIGLWVLSGLIFLLAASGVPAYFIATEKLNVGSDAFKQAVTSVVFSIPFVPKTPKYILISSVAAHQKLLKNSYDVSVAATSNDLAAMIGSNTMDAQLKGYADFSDSKNPKFSLAIDITKEFSGEVRKNDKMIYFKVNKLPPFVTAFTGIDPEKMNAILQNWIGWDSTPLDTEARKALDSVEKPKSAVDENVLKIYEKMLSEEVLPNLKVTNENLDSIPVYKFDFSPSAETVDRIALKARTEYNNAAGSKDNKIPEPKAGEPKVSDVFKDIKLNLWIGRNDYYLRKATLTFTMDAANPEVSSGLAAGLPLPVSVKSPVTVSMALTMSDFGKVIPIETPAKYLTPEEIYKQIMESSVMFNATPSGM